MSQSSLEIGHPYFRLKDKKSESMWDDYEFGANQYKYAEYVNDFFSFNSGDWTITTTEDGGGDASEAIADAVGGVLLITNDAGASDLDNLQLLGESILPAAGKKVYFEARYYIGDVSSSSTFLGVAVTDTSLIASAPSNRIGFTTAGDSTLGFACGSSTVASLATLTDSGYVKVGFKCVGTGKIDYWVNDVKKGTITSGIPTSEMRLSFAITNGTTAAETMGIDYVRMDQER